MEALESHIYKQFFPTELTDYFTISSIETLCNIEAKSEFVLIHFEEQNILPDWYSSADYESKGFVESKLIQDFPLRGKRVFFKLKKRRWRHKITNAIIKRDYSFIADGSKFTRALSDFLKDASGYATRYHQQHSELLRGQ